MNKGPISCLSPLGLRYAMLALMLGASSTPVVAQIVPDATLPTNTLVNQNGNTFTIDGGTTLGTNLFHSFQEFSLPTGNTAFFNNSLTIENIITRVTGGQVSNIDGLIRANGGANLFLINPSGIMFGANAKLDIGGSFLGSTASTLKFADGTEFSATNPQTPPLLTISVPMGLQLGQNSGPISVAGTGHRLTSQGSSFVSPLQRPSSTQGLQVKPGHTLALVGGQVVLEGGLLTADSGRIEIGSVSGGQVTLNPTAMGWTLSYPEGLSLGDIHLKAGALLDTGGDGGSGIQLVGRQITMSDGSLALIQTQGVLPGGTVTLQASESVDLSGTNPKGIPSGLRTQTVAAGKGGNINVFTPRLRLRDGGTIDVVSFSLGRAGNILLDARDSIQVIGASPLSELNLSAINSSNFNLGGGGDFTVSTANLQLIDGGVMTAVTYGPGAGGNMYVNVANSLEVIGFNRVSPTANRFRSVILAETSGSGKAGNLTINTSRLSIRDGGRIGASTVASGDGGNLTVNASESIEVSGVGSGTSLGSSLSSAALANAPVQRILGLPLIPSGDAGMLTINTAVLVVSNQGRVGVENQGFGNAGGMTIIAGQIVLDRGNINASTVSGFGGNINLKVGNYVLLRNRSQITAQAGETGNGGNIIIDSPFVVALIPENSDIIANAFAGEGGKININATGVFGLVQTRGSLNNSISEINASSQAGIDGVVAINSPEVDTSSGLVKLPEQVTNPSNQIVVGCAAARGNSFTVTGRGGIPEDPTAAIRGETIWGDLQDFSEAGEVSDQGKTNSSSSVQDVVVPPPRLVEATSWIINAQGQVELVADLPNDSITKQPQCQDLAKSVR